MDLGAAIIVDALAASELGPSRRAIYDREIGVRLLHRDPGPGEEHYLVRYPAGLQARAHRHTAAQTIVLLEGRLAVNDEEIGAGGYCHLPAGRTMLHAPAGDGPSLFVSVFHGPLDVEMVEGEYGEAVVVDGLGSLETTPSMSVVYDREIGVRLLHQDPGSDEEHYLIRYPAGLKARPHRRTAAHTIIVLEGRLEANGRVVGPGAYCHFPAGEPMIHAPAEGGPCLFVILFHGPHDVEPLDA